MRLPWSGHQSISRLKTAHEFSRFAVGVRRSSRRNSVDGDRPAHRPLRYPAHRAVRSRHGRSVRGCARCESTTCSSTRFNGQGGHVSSPASVGSRPSMRTWLSGITGSTRDDERPRFVRISRPGVCSRMVARTANPPPTSELCRQCDRPLARRVGNVLLFGHRDMVRASLSLLGYDHTTSEPVIRLWNEGAPFPRP
jgi:hypothetical protein